MVMLGSTDVDKLTRIQAAEVDPFLSLSLLQSYVAFTNDMHQQELQHTQRRAVCSRHWDKLSAGRTVQLAPGRFAQRNGDVIETFTCVSSIVELRDAPDCHQDIPVQGSYPFIDQDSHVMISASPVVPCTPAFPRRVKDRHQQWWKLTPAITRENAPATWNDEDEDATPGHLDKLTGLYTQDEKKQWAAIRAVPVYRKQLYGMIEQGSCGTVESCPAEHAQARGGFDLGSLATQLPGYAVYEALTNPNYWATALSWLAAVVVMVLGYRGRRAQNEQGGASAAAAAAAPTVFNYAVPTLTTTNPVAPAPLAIELGPL